MSPNSYYFRKLPKLTQKRVFNHPDVNAEWIENLDHSVECLADKWRLSLGNVLKGGAQNLLLEANLESGQPAVLKMALPGGSIISEASALKMANGVGYVKIYKVDYDQGALLLERLGQPLSASPSTIPHHMEVICSTLKKAWIKPTNFGKLPTAIDKALQMKGIIEGKWMLLDQPFSRQTMELALDYIEARIQAFSPESSVLLHGDAHGFNILEAEGGEYKFIDPDGLVGEKGCDLICLMRDWSELLLKGDTLELTNERCALLAKLSGADEQAIWQWGFLGRLVIGLTLLEFGDMKLGKNTLEVADRISHYRWL